MYDFVVCGLLFCCVFSLVYFLFADATLVGIQSYMLRDEEFCMQTDSHMDVVQDWDAKLMAMWGRVRNEYGILTTYVHKIEQVNDGAENKNEVPHLCQVCCACMRGINGLFCLIVCVV